MFGPARRAPAFEHTGMLTSSPRNPLLWKLAQGSGVLLTLALLVALLRWPQPSLTLLWNLVIPLVPASLLVAPQLWRNVCPLATLNMASNGWFGRRRANPRFLAGTTALGIVLLFLLVPARHLLFNMDGTALAVTIAAVAVLAVALGAGFDAKAGFCNSLCPVLPVERLYGQAPFVELSNPRCATCSGCSPKGCIDLAPAHSIGPMIATPRPDRAWWRSSFGAFAAAFPGFVLGYYLVPDGSLSDAPAVYGTIGATSLASFLLAVGATTWFGVPARSLMPVLAAAAAGIYYWFAGPTLAGTLALGPAGALALRILFLGLVAVWFVRAAGRSRNQDSPAA